jgi:uncharacterized protein (DUF488 family)
VRCSAAIPSHRRVRVCATPSAVAVDAHIDSGARIYSVGYEGFDVDALVSRLAASHVAGVIDVRLNPSSRRPGFSRRALSATLEQAGIAYVHEPELGNPADNRDSFRRGDDGEGRRRMRERLEHGSRPAVDRLIEQARVHPVAVLCLERDPGRCHRTVITQLVQELDPSIEIIQIL